MGKNDKNYATWWALIITWIIFIIVLVVMMGTHKDNFHSTAVAIPVEIGFDDYLEEMGYQEICEEPYFEYEYKAVYDLADCAHKFCGIYESDCEDEWEWDPELGGWCADYCREDCASKNYPYFINETVEHCRKFAMVRYAR